MKRLLDLYKTRKYEIVKRLEEFKTIMNKSNEDIFAEFAFCILTPQSSAKTAWNIITRLKENNLLFNGTGDHIKPFLNPIRFNDVKAKRLVKNRGFFTENGKLIIKNKLTELPKNPILLREWLVDKLPIDGYGMKEASHFIRNAGLSNNQLAILDRHILKNLKEFGVIEKIPKSLTTKKYLEMEERMRKFSDKVGIPMDELDLLLFFKETGMIFK